MPVYTYRREDGTTFDLRQKFTDDPLTVDPETGQRVVRVVHAAGVIFKGSGFYVNDSKSGSRSTLNSTSSKDGAKDNGKDGGSSTETKSSDGKSSDGKSSESKPAAKEASTPVKADLSAAAD
jgi:putative FmdB family regulatory protein